MATHCVPDPRDVAALHRDLDVRSAAVIPRSSRVLDSYSAFMEAVGITPTGSRVISPICRREAGLLPCGLATNYSSRGARRSIRSRGF